VLEVNRYTDDIFERVDYLKNMISNTGTTLVLCDNGNKPLEVQAFAPALKPGDVIMAHDYFPVKQEPGESEDSCEIVYASIEDTCNANRIVPFYDDVFIPLRWFCGRSMNLNENSCS